MQMGRPSIKGEYPDQEYMTYNAPHEETKNHTFEVFVSLLCHGT